MTSHLRHPRTVILTVVACWYYLNACAQDTSAGDPMNQYIAAAKPGEAHAFLARFEGKWKYESTMYFSGTDPVRSTGTANIERIMGGRYVVAKYGGEMNGMAFEGRSLMGYDPVESLYYSTWIDNLELE